jgi:topoisomerase-4 subunit A
MIKTIENCLKEFSDDRRSQLIERKTASRSTYVPPVPKEAVTIILSKNNWVKLAKGHDFDGTQTNFKTGDAYATSIQGQSHWPTILFDEAGVAYTLSTHELPSVRSQGEPITTMVNPSAKIRPQLINAKHEQSLLLASKLGYGFISELSPLTSRNKTGKKVLSLGDSQIANILPIYEDTTHIALITQQGRVLVISPNDIPRLNKGKGNKLIQIHKKDHANNEDAIVFIQPLTENAALVIHSGKRFFKITTKDLPQYFGPRGQRGVLLPRGYRRVTNVEIQAEKLSSNL